MKNFPVLAVCAVAVLSAFVFQPSAIGQSLLSGDISGTVTDPSGAVVADAAVNLKSADTGAAQTTKTGDTGTYRFSLLKPGNYLVSVSKTGFQTAEKKGVSVLVGQIATTDVQLAIGQSSQTVDVTESQPILNAAASPSTSYTPLEEQLLPNAGGDITNIAETATGVVMNTVMGTSGYGNFSMNGLPATSNLFTLNGENEMDPYFNINMTGAENLTMGQNEIQEATVIANPYGGQYGQLSGAQVILVTKSGSNDLHGDAKYWWNGRALNANDWLSNSLGESRPFSNANQWAADLGGRIKKDRTFFYVDTEGLRFVLPNVDNIVIPTQAFATAVLSNVTALHPSEASAYKTMLGLLTGAPGASAAVAIPNSSDCNKLALPGFNPATQACAAKFEATPTALAKDWVLAGRIDQKISNRDNAYFRYRTDHGVQPSVIDAVSPNFDALSAQPEYDNQFNETHIFSPNATNQFMASLSHYVSQFAQNPQLVASTFPYSIFTSGDVPFGGPVVGTTGFNAQADFPQGRNITQYQFIDDFTLVKGRNTFKFGENFRRYDVSDHSFPFSNPAVYFGFNSQGLQNFANGVAYQYRRSLNLASDVPIALWGMGAYVHDDIKVASNFTMTIGMRFEHNSNPVCQTNCFSNTTGPITSLASYTASAATQGTVPYSADFKTGLHQAYPGVDSVNFLPSAGFNWGVGKDHKTVLSGGFGVFYDNAPAGLVDGAAGFGTGPLANPPVTVAIRVRPSAGILPFDNGPTGGASVWQNSANAFSMSKSFSQISSQLSALGSIFTAPAVTAIVGTVHSPRVEEWNFQIQRQLSDTTALTVNYVGNHTMNLPYSNSFYNAYDAFGVYSNVKGIPSAAPDANYGQMNQVQSGAIANYEGLQVSFRKAFSHGVSGHFNYTWSHALDEVSNGGLFSYGDSLLGQMTPYSLAYSNYGNADYDIRHSFTADLVYTPTVKSASQFEKQLVNGWQFGTKITYHTGLPFSVTDGNQALGNYSGSLLAIPTGKTVMSGSCSEAATSTSCINPAAFVDGSTIAAYTSLSPQTRNQYRGAGFFDMDLNIFRNFPLRDRTNLAIGMSAFNFLNHPNFLQPVSNYGDPQFGNVTGLAGAPTSPYGNFLGFDSSVRVIQLTGKLTF